MQDLFLHFLCYYCATVLVCCCTTVQLAYYCCTTTVLTKILLHLDDSNQDGIPENVGAGRRKGGGGWLK